MSADLTSTKTVYLGLGTNLGDREANLHDAMTALPPSILVLEQSPVYATQPWGVIDQPTFLNLVLKGKTRLAPLALLAYLKDLEIRLGRLPSVRYGPRKIDIDILLYADLILDRPGLTIPHPGLHERAFVLVPLADLAPDLIHPVFRKTICQLLAGVDISGVKRYG
jgi:2-amino-4-hydroxy-6-hydroxymethyldihydropteridine diphosphokinase